MKINHALLALLTALWMTGCEINPQEGTDDAIDSSAASVTPVASNTVPAATAAPEPTATSSDDLDISSAQMLGPHKGMVAQNAAITRALYTANKEGDNVRLAFETLGWPVKHGSKDTDGGVYIFWVDGSQVVGGLFDWHGVGQTVKTLENIHGGYLDGRQPAGGATIYFALVSHDASQRTNVKRSESSW